MSKLEDAFHREHARVTGHKAPLDLNIKKGALHAELGIPAQNKIPVSRLRAAAKTGGPLERRRANLALNMRGWNHARGPK